MPTFYIAGRASRQAEFREYRAQYESLGRRCTARWLDLDFVIGNDGLSAQLPDAERAAVARDDAQDVEDADEMLVFTEAPRSAPGRGGRHVELGMALALGKSIVLIGPRENTFCHLINEQYECFDDFKAARVGRPQPERGAT